MNLPEILRKVDENPTTAAYAAAARALKEAAAGLPEFRLGVLVNHTFDIGVPLTVECARRGLRLSLYMSGYDQYRQELLDPASGLDAFRSDAILISLDLSTSIPNLDARPS